MTTYNFCTYFDKNYLFKGLTLFDSIKVQKIKFNFWILCFDNLTFRVIKQLNYPEIKLILIDKLEEHYPELTKVKKTRSSVEYFWTCTPFLPDYILRSNPDVDIITYLDADMFFFSHPSPIYHDFGNNSIYIVEHRFPEQYKISGERDAGKYNVGIMLFRNDDNAKSCLKWWQEKCLEWCYNSIENGMLGDQKYLDEFRSKFNKVKVSSLLSVGLGGWNYFDHAFNSRNNTLYVDNKPMIIFHFNWIEIIKPRLFDIMCQRKYHVLTRSYTKNLAHTINIIIKNYPELNKFHYCVPIHSILRGLFNGSIVHERIRLYKMDLIELKQRIKQIPIIGFCGRKTKNILRLLAFVMQYYCFRKDMLKQAKQRFNIKWKERLICLGENTEAPQWDSHYIYHSAWAARYLKNHPPSKEHIDISSCLYFISIASAFIPIKYYDYRPVPLCLDNLSSEKADLLSLPFESNSIESLSCMHVVEHIGLGRYGDPIDPDGDLKAVAELKRVLKFQGVLLFVVPVGRPKIQFNANRIYSYEQVIQMFNDNCDLIGFSLITDNAEFIENAKKELVQEQEFGCGCFVFRKK